MDILAMEYIISEDKGDTTRHWEDIIGALRINYNGVILTKLVDYPDEGYIGYWIYHDIEVWMRSLKQLISDGEASLGFTDDSYYFRFRLENENVIFLIDVGNAEQNRLYPGEGKGYPLLTRLFLKESIALGHRFIDDITSRYKNMDLVEIYEFKQALGEADHYVNEYMKTH